MNREVRQMKHGLLGLFVVVMLLVLFPLTALACHITDWGHSVNCAGFVLTGLNDYDSSVWVSWTARLYAEDASGGVGVLAYTFTGGFSASPNSNFEYPFDWPDTVADGAYWAEIDASGGTTYNPAMDPGIVLPCEDPTAVDLVSFEAKAKKNAVVLTWETASELDNLGFNLYRAESADGPYTQLNASLIPSLVPPGSPVGAVYTYRDRTAQPGIKYFYKLESVDIYGNSTFHGPVDAMIRPRAF